MAIFDPVRMSAVALDVMAAGRLTPASIAERQSRRLSSLLSAAASESPLYRELLRGLPAESTPLAKLPIVTRDELMERFDDWVCDRQLKRSGLQAFTADPQRIAEPYLGKYMVWESSGTGGKPGIFVQDASAMATYDALEALRCTTPKSLHRWLDPLYLSERIAFIGATSGHFASFVSLKRLCEINPWMAHATKSFSILQPIATLVDALNRFGPTIIVTYPTMASLLADESSRGTLTIRPHEMWTGGEMLTAGVRQWIKNNFNCVLRNSYGASEFLAIGWECAYQQMHVNTDWLLLEPVDAQHQPVPPGEQSYTTLLTNLANVVQPLIRYDLGDQITVNATPCECGSPFPSINIIGRHDDPLNMRDGHGGLVTLLPLALTTVLEDQAGVFEFQLCQLDDHRLELRLPQSGADGASTAARCRQALQAFARLQGLAPLHLIVKMDTALQRGRSGKVQRVVAKK